MSNSIIPSLELLLIAGRAIALLSALAVFSWAFVRWRDLAQRDTQRLFEQLDQVRAELTNMREMMHGTSQGGNSRSQRVAHDFRSASTQGGGAARGYELAARLARNGAPKDELIRTCGITAHEADLLVKLHGRPGSVGKSTSFEADLAEIARQAAHAAQSATPSQQRPNLRSRLMAIG